MELRDDLAPARGLHGRAADAFVEAKVLEAALLAAATGQAIDDPWVGARPEGESITDEVDWLREVASHITPPRRVWQSGASIRSGERRVA